MILFCEGSLIILFHGDDLAWTLMSPAYLTLFFVSLFSQLPSEYNLSKAIIHLL